MFKKYIYSCCVFLSLITSLPGRTDDILGSSFIFTSPIGLSSGHINLGVGGQVADNVYLGFKAMGMVSAYEIENIEIPMEGESTPGSNTVHARGYGLFPELFYELPPIQAVRLAHYVRISIYYMNERRTAGSLSGYDTIVGIGEEAMYFVTHEIGHDFRIEVGQGAIKFPGNPNPELSVEINLVYRLGGGAK